MGEIRKTCPVTAESFICTGDSSCWCMNLPSVGLRPEGECLGPKALTELIEFNREQVVEDLNMSDSQNYQLFNPNLVGWIHQEKYALKNTSTGEILEATPEETFRRVASAIADDAQQQRQFLEIMVDRKFTPAGRILAGAGTGSRVTYSNCFVMPTIEDSIVGEMTKDGIFDVLSKGAVTQQAGGGIGMDMSPIRPRGAVVKRTNSISSGVLPFMDTFDRMSATIKSSGSRRGAMLATLSVSHPDIREFIVAKQESGRLSNYNVSVAVSDEFMRAVVEDKEWNLVHQIPPAGVDEESHPKFGGKFVYDKIKARDLWDLIIRSTYDYAEPGVLFIDTINNRNNLKAVEEIAATNPCGEQPLPPNGACNLASLILPQFVKFPFTDEAYVDWEEIKRVTRLGVHFLDNVLDCSMYPLHEQLDESMLKRRVGLGFTGLGDMFAMMKVKYSSAEAVFLAEKLAETMCNAAYAASAEYAALKGSFPLYSLRNFKDTWTWKVLAPEVRRSIEESGLRNSHLISVAPTGTISSHADNCSSGIEPIFAHSYERRSLKSGTVKDEFETFVIKDRAVAQFESLYPGKPLPDYMETAADLTVAQHLAVMIAIQPWVDSAISKTINIPEDYPIADFGQVYMDAWKGGLKGCTTYRPNPVRPGILKAVKEEKPVESVTTELAQRPVKLTGATYKIKWALTSTTIYLTVNDLDGKPYEVLITTSNPAMQEWLAALTRTISAIYRRGGDTSFLAQELLQVHSPLGGQMTQKGGYVPSLVAMIGKTLMEHSSSMESAKPRFHDETLKCPQCSAQARREEGCLKCDACGFSKCG